MRRQSDRAKLERYLDSMLHGLVMDRDRFRCRKCGKANRLTAAHIYPKGRHPSMRYVLDNVVALCWLPCHDWWHKNPMESFPWATETLGKPLLERLTLMAYDKNRKTNRQNDRLWLEAEMKKRGLPLPAPPRISTVKRGRIKA